jgi:hypothetical protein
MGLIQDNLKSLSVTGCLSEYKCKCLGLGSMIAA